MRINSIARLMQRMLKGQAVTDLAGPTPFGVPASTSTEPMRQAEGNRLHS